MLSVPTFSSSDVVSNIEVVHVDRPLANIAGPLGFGGPDVFFPHFKALVLGQLLTGLELGSLRFIKPVKHGFYFPLVVARVTSHLRLAQQVAEGTGDRRLALSLTWRTALVFAWYITSVLADRLTVADDLGSFVGWSVSRDGVGLTSEEAPTLDCVVRVIGCATLAGHLGLPDGATGTAASPWFQPAARRDGGELLTGSGTVQGIMAFLQKAAETSRVDQRSTEPFAFA